MTIDDDYDDDSDDDDDDEMIEVMPLGFALYVLKAGP